MHTHRGIFLQRWNHTVHLPPPQRGLPWSPHLSSSTFILLSCVTAFFITQMDLFCLLVHRLSLLAECQPCEGRDFAYHCHVPSALNRVAKYSIPICWIHILQLVHLTEQYNHKHLFSVTDMDLPQSLIQIHGILLIGWAMFVFPSPVE